MDFNMTDEAITKIIDDITAIGIDEDKAAEIIGIIIENIEKGYFDYEGTNDEKQQLILENEKLVDKIKKIAVEGVMKSKNCRNIKALSALVDMDNVNVDDEGNVVGIDIEKLVEEYPYLFEKEKSKRYGNGFNKSGKSESSIEKNFKKGLFRI